MLLSINPKKQTTEIVSVPRDTQAEIVVKERLRRLIMHMLMVDQRWLLNH